MCLRLKGSQATHWLIGHTAMAFDSTGIDARIVYRHRFDSDIDFRSRMWKILCQGYFQRFIAEDATVLEIAAGYCEFINNIRAKRKVAIDINEETQHRAGPDVEVILTSSTDLSAIPGETIDVVFVSNFFEHIGKPDITKTLPGQSHYKGSRAKTLAR